MKIVTGIIILNLFTYYGGHMADGRPLPQKEFEELGHAKSTAAGVIDQSGGSNKPSSPGPAPGARGGKSVTSDSNDNWSCPPHLPLFAGALCAMAFA